MRNYTYEELETLGIGSIGNNVKINYSVQFYAPQHIHIGNDVRIDCFALMSAGEEGIFLGNNIHIAAGGFMFGGGGRITLEDYCGTSARVTLLTASDDYSEGYMTNPTVPDKFKKVKTGRITLRKHAIIGTGSVVFPNVEIGIAASVGALSVVTSNIDPFMIAFGNPARVLGKRNEQILEIERKYLCEYGSGTE